MSLATHPWIYAHRHQEWLNGRAVSVMPATIGINAFCLDRQRKAWMARLRAP